jgi:hypothetical protein
VTARVRCLPVTVGCGGAADVDSGRVFEVRADGLWNPQRIHVRRGAGTTGFVGTTGPPDASPAYAASLMYPDRDRRRGPGLEFGHDAHAPCEVTRIEGLVS